jgi:hypothetical protein
MMSDRIVIWFIVAVAFFAPVIVEGVARRCGF